MKLSKFGEKFTRQAGILSLMDDLDRALASDREDLIMMGGGNPGHIPQMQDVVRQRLQDLLADPDKLHRLVGVYGPPQGDWDFIKALAQLLNRECGWDVGPENIALTNGSQSAFFLLFNMFAGPCSDSSQRQSSAAAYARIHRLRRRGLERPLFYGGAPRHRIYRRPYV